MTKYQDDKTVPVYATINYFGNGWSVHYKSYGSTRNITHSGYGPFPHDRFPGIPVIDFTGNDGVIQAIAIKLDDMPREVNPSCNGTLESYLDKIRSFGISVR